MEEIKRKQIIFDVNPGLHAEIKAMAALKMMSMNNWMQRAILEQLKKDKKSIELGGVTSLGDK